MAWAEILPMQVFLHVYYFYYYSDVSLFQCFRTVNSVKFCTVSLEGRHSSLKIKVKYIKMSQILLVSLYTSLFHNLYNFG